jgi:response regulator RpfG family c-di-GMP phosphodiesterase
MTPAPANDAPARTRVLLVDDQPIVEAAVRKCLEPFPDIELVAVRDADAGLDEAVARRPDVILQDLVMPGVDGMAQIRRIRAHADLATVPLVVLSADSDPATKNRCFELGANDYVVKLPDALELVARIRYHGRMGRAQHERDGAMAALARSQAELERRNREMDAANRRLAAMNDLLGQESAEHRERIAEVAALGSRLGRAQDLDEVMEQSLSLARAFTDADAGSIWVVEDGGLRLVYSQNDTLQAALGGGRLPLADVSVPIDASSVAGYAASSGQVVRIEDVRGIPADAPFRFQGAVDQRTGYVTRAMLVAPLRDARDAIVGVLQLMNARGRGRVPAEQATFTRTDESAIELFAGMASLALERARLVRSVIMRTIATAEMRDPTETGSHVQRVSECSVAIYDAWAARHGVDAGEQARKRDELRIAAMLHDVGKVAIPDRILKKPGKLDDAEYAHMQTHVLAGGRLFAEAATPYDAASREVALHHHERWDGAGYPGEFAVEELRTLPQEVDRLPGARPLGGEEIPLFARIVAVADVYDALTSKRAYKDAWDDARVAEFLRKESGHHFDPEIVDLALGLQPYFRSVRERYPGGDHG